MRRPLPAGTLNTTARGVELPSVENGKWGEILGKVERLLEEGLAGVGDQLGGGLGPKRAGGKQPPGKVGIIAIYFTSLLTYLG